MSGVRRPPREPRTRPSSSSKIIRIPLRTRSICSIRRSSHTTPQHTNAHAESDNAQPPSSATNNTPQKTHTKKSPHAQNSITRPPAQCWRDIPEKERAAPSRSTSCAPRGSSAASSGRSAFSPLAAVRGVDAAARPAHGMHATCMQTKANIHRPLSVVQRPPRHQEGARSSLVFPSVALALALEGEGPFHAAALFRVEA